MKPNQPRQQVASWSASIVLRNRLAKCSRHLVNPFRFIARARTFYEKQKVTARIFTKR